MTTKWEWTLRKSGNSQSNLKNIKPPKGPHCEGLKRGVTVNLRWALASCLWNVAHT